MTTILDLADTRGTANIGWLYSRHTFSFADYHNSNRMGFGVLRVINDDIVAPAKGFDTHPHRDMEIISIPLSGSLRHQDNMGNQHVIQAGEIQIMSAGTGITHSEFNHSENDDVNFLQIWVLPKEKHISPRYDQRELDTSAMNNHFQLVVAPLDDKSHSVIQINQDAYFSMADINACNVIKYTKYQQDNAVYFFIIDGSINIDMQTLNKRDGMGITDGSTFDISANKQSKVLVMEIPMHTKSSQA